LISYLFQIIIIIIIITIKVTL